MSNEQESEEFREGGSLEGRYANYFKVGYNAFEFLLDFGQFYPEAKAPIVYPDHHQPDVCESADRDPQGIG